MHLLFSSLLMTGCVADVDIDLDADQDGLLASEEAELGTDPTEKDSDKDGYDDGIELDENTDPADKADKPYELGWKIDACRHDVEATGYSKNDVAEDFALVDQLGETVHLHDFCDQVVYLVFAAFW